MSEENLHNAEVLDSSAADRATEERAFTTGVFVCTGINVFFGVVGTGFAIAWMFSSGVLFSTLAYLGIFCCIPGIACGIGALFLLRYRLRPSLILAGIGALLSIIGFLFTIIVFLFGVYISFIMSFQY
jgi:hypothetical protein